MMLGNNFFQPNDPLIKISLSQLTMLIAQPTAQQKEKYFQFRSVHSINPEKTTEVLYLLPYWVVGVFNPPLRQNENFGMASCIVLSIDQLASKQLLVNQLKKRFKNDDRISIIYSQPDGNGINMIFKLSTPCYDANKYQLLWFKFANRFFNEYNISQSLNYNLSNVCLPHFIGYDPDVIYNEKALAIQLNEIDYDDNLSSEDYQPFFKKIKKSQDIVYKDNLHAPPLSPEQLIEIKKKLGIAHRSTGKRKEFQKRMENFLHQLQEKFNQHQLIINHVEKGDHRLKIFFSDKFNTQLEYKINIFFEGNTFYFTRPATSDTQLNDTFHSAIIILRQIISKGY